LLNVKMEYVGRCLPEDIPLLQKILSVHNAKISSRFGSSITNVQNIVYTNLYKPIEDGILDGELIGVTSEISQRLQQPDSDPNNSALTMPTVLSLCEFNDFLKSVQKRVYGDECRKILTAGIIVASPGNETQMWHFDYNGKTENILIPYVPITENNGTDYVQFESVESAKFWYPYLKDSQGEQYHYDLPNLFPDNDLRHNIPHCPSKRYRLERWKADPFTITRMPFYMFHRGPKNRENYKKLMFYLCTTDDMSFFVPEHQKAAVIVTDVEDDPNLVLSGVVLLNGNRKQEN